MAYVVLCTLGEAELSWWLPRRPFNAAALPDPLEGLIAVIEAGNPVAAVSSVFQQRPDRAGAAAVRSAATPCFTASSLWGRR